MVELEDLGQLKDHLAAHGDLDGAVVQGLDLTGEAARLAAVSYAGSALLGCRLPPGHTLRAIAEGALVFPELPDLPYAPYRPALYTAEELYEGFDPARPETYATTPDARVYAHWKAAGGARPPAILETLAQRLHDHAVTDALERFLAGGDGGPRRVVAVMGGHGMARDAGGPYARVARLSRDLAGEGFTMISGGGPGAMEATHLGAWFVGRPDRELDEALEMLRAAPTYKHPRWLAEAFAVRARFPLSDADRARAPSLGIPTWLYGHEPPNPFATHIAKYFANSVREDGLLMVATAGVVFSPGSAGTIQEIFQDACQNHYLTAGVASPMVFLDEEYWTVTKPVYPLLERLARGKDYHAWLRITDRGDEVVRVLKDYAAAADAGPA